MTTRTPASVAARMAGFFARLAPLPGDEGKVYHQQLFARDPLNTDIPVPRQRRCSCDPIVDGQPDPIHRPLCQLTPIYARTAAEDWDRSYPIWPTPLL